MNQINYGDCKFCGAENVKNPKTGKIFCSKKCWLLNDEPTYEGKPNRPQPRVQQPNWPEIVARKEEGMTFLNAKNNASVLLAAAIKAGWYSSLDEVLGDYEKVCQKIYEVGNDKNGK